MINPVSKLLSHRIIKICQPQRVMIKKGLKNIEQDNILTISFLSIRCWAYKALRFLALVGVPLMKEMSKT